MSRSLRAGKHVYNWRPDLPDQRDFLFGLKVATETSILPRAVDLKPYCSPVVNQGKIGSCTGNALAGALEFLELQEMKNLQKGPHDPQVFDPGEFAAFSRLFIYYNERALEGRIKEDAGASLRDGVKTLASVGACRESTWAYVAAKLFSKPSVKAFNEAKKHCVSSYLRLENFADLKRCLADGFPFVFGFTVYESFESATTARTGTMTMPRVNERVLGGHAVMAVGYDDAEQHFLVRNSWGTEWGNAGYFTMPYAYVDERGLAQDFWTLRN